MAYQKLSNIASDSILLTKPKGVIIPQLRSQRYKNNAVMSICRKLVTIKIQHPLMDFDKT